MTCKSLNDLPVFPTTLSTFSTFAHSFMVTLQLCSHFRTFGILLPQIFAWLSLSTPFRLCSKVTFCMRLFLVIQSKNVMFPLVMYFPCFILLVSIHYNLTKCLLTYIFTSIVCISHQNIIFMRVENSVCLLLQEVPDKQQMLNKYLNE